jgi:hypothetical protein
LDQLLGLVLLAIYIAAIVGLAGLVTYLAIRIFPTKSHSSKKDDGAPPSSDDGAGAGRLFRRAKREAT